MQLMRRLRLPVKRDALQIRRPSLVQAAVRRKPMPVLSLLALFQGVFDDIRHCILDRFLTIEVRLPLMLCPHVRWATVGVRIFRKGMSSILHQVSRRGSLEQIRNLLDLVTMASDHQMRMLGKNRTGQDLILAGCCLCFESIGDRQCLLSVKSNRRILQGFPGRFALRELFVGELCECALFQVASCFAKASKFPARYKV